MPDKTFLSWPFFSENHRELAKSLETWARENIPSYQKEDEYEACKQIVLSLGETGWLKYVVPENFGGINEKLDVRSLCIIRETLARYSSLADFVFAMQGVGSGAISLFGSGELKEKYLLKVAAGSAIAAFALSEKDAGSDLNSIQTTIEKEGSDYILNGSKTWISNAGIADFYVVFGQNPGEDRNNGLTAIVVDANTSGLECSEKIEIISPHPLGTIIFKNCRVPESQLVGLPGQGLKIALSTLDVFRSTVGAAALGFARKALDEAVARCKKRQISGQLLSEYQMIQQKIAEMAVQIDASALLVYRAAWSKDNGAERIPREAAMAKLYATESAQQVIDSAVQIFGGLGVVSGMPVEELYRDIRPLRIYEGTSEIQKLIIAKETLKEL